MPNRATPENRLPSLEEFQPEPEFAATLVNFFDRLIDDVIDGFGIEIDPDAPSPPGENEGTS